VIELEGFLGEVMQPGDDDYESARRIWNGDIDRRPAVIARCGGTADVLAAVRFARERELPWRSEVAGMPSPATPSARAAWWSTCRP
jgi:hypothetical protein